MNVIALIGAAVGLAILILTVFLGNKIKNRFMRYTSAAVGIIISIVVAGTIPGILGAHDTVTSSKAGEYMLYLAVVFFIIKALFFRKRTTF
jgi:H+/Cl- antiporter ClcA